MVQIISNKYKINKSLLKDLLQKVQKELGLKGKVVIKLGEKDESQTLNKDYRKKDYPTDVLTFPMMEKLPGGFYAGDIHICYPIALSQAEEASHTIDQELFILMTHGLIHLAGYDHEEDSGEMLSLQEKLIKQYLPD